MSDPVGNVTGFSYDSRNRLLSEVDPLGAAIRCVYDSVGDLEYIFGPGRDSYHEYDELNRLEKLTQFVDDGDDVHDGESAIATFDYYLNDKGERIGLVETIDTLTTLYAWSYDNTGRLIEKRIDAPGTDSRATLQIPCDLSLAVRDHGRNRTVPARALEKLLDANSTCVRFANDTHLTPAPRATLLTFPTRRVNYGEPPARPDKRGVLSRGDRASCIELAPAGAILPARSVLGTFTHAWRRTIARRNRIAIPARPRTFGLGFLAVIEIVPPLCENRIASGLAGGGVPKFAGPDAVSAAG